MSKCKEKLNRRQIISDEMSEEALTKKKERTNPLLRV